MDDSIDFRIFKIIEELCKCVKYDNEVVVYYVKEVFVFNFNFRDGFEN